MVSKASSELCPLASQSGGFLVVSKTSVNCLVLPNRALKKKNQTQNPQHLKERRNHQHKLREDFKNSIQISFRDKYIAFHRIGRFIPLKNRTPMLLILVLSGSLSSFIIWQSSKY